MTAPVTVRAVGGTVSTVSLRNADGKLVAGTFNAEPDGLDLDRAARLRQELLAGRGGGQRRRQRPRAHQHVLRPSQPRTFTLPYLFPGGPGGPKTVGVGQPIQVRFDEAIVDKAAAEKALVVTTSPHVAGAWHWFGDQVVHWRPQHYWKPGTKVTVNADVYGVDVGNGIYGQQDVTPSFTIGAAKIFTIDDKTHTGVITVNGKKTRTVPVSMGRGGSYTVDGQTIYFTTQSGPHIVKEKYPVKRMTSASYGLPKDTPLGYDENISLAVRISVGRRVRPLGALVGAGPRASRTSRTAASTCPRPTRNSSTARSPGATSSTSRTPASTLPFAAERQRVGRHLGEVGRGQRAELRRDPGCRSRRRTAPPQTRDCVALSPPDARARRGVGNVGETWSAETCAQAGV